MGITLRANDECPTLVTERCQRNLKGFDTCRLRIGRITAAWVHHNEGF